MAAAVCWVDLDLLNSGRGRCRAALAIPRVCQSTLGHAGGLSNLSPFGILCDSRKPRASIHRRDLSISRHPRRRGYQSDPWLEKGSKRARKTRFRLAESLEAQSNTERGAVATWSMRYKLPSSQLCQLPYGLPLWKVGQLAF